MTIHWISLLSPACPLLDRRSSDIHSPIGHEITSAQRNGAIRSTPRRESVRDRCRRRAVRAVPAPDPPAAALREPELRAPVRLAAGAPGRGAPELGLPGPAARRTRGRCRRAWRRGQRSDRLGQRLARLPCPPGCCRCPATPRTSVGLPLPAAFGRGRADDACPDLAVRLGGVAEFDLVVRRAAGAPLAPSGMVSWFIRVPGYGMKNSPMSEPSRAAALALLASALAYSFWSSRPITMRVSLATGGG